MSSALLSPEENSGNQIVEASESSLSTIHRILTPEALNRLCEEDKRTEFLVEDILPRRSIAVIGGDSGIGKSPWIYMLGICVAEGRPFAGHHSQRERVLYYDLENSSHDSRRVRDAVLKFLALENLPENFHIKLDPPEGMAGLEKDIEALRPGLVIIDTLREFNPEATDKNTKTAALLKAIRVLVRKHGCTVILIHHIRKPNQDSRAKVPKLADTSVLTWLLAMEGPRSLVNQSDVRIAIEEGDGDPSALDVKWNRRTRGDSPLVKFERVFDETGDAIGYRHLSGPALLGPEWSMAFESLPQEFRFSDVLRALESKSSGTASRFIEACQQFEVAEKIGRGRYRKLPGGASRRQTPDKADIDGK